MKEASKKVFDRLRKVVSDGGEDAHANDIDAPRWIAGDADASDALAHAALIDSQLIPGIGQFSWLEWKSTLFLVGIGPLSTVPSIHHLVDEPDNPGLATLALGVDDALSVSALPVEIAEVAFGTPGPLPLEIVAPLFGGVRTWSLASSGLTKAPLRSSLSKTVAAMSVMNGSCPNWAATLVGAFNHMCQGDASKFAGDAILSAALSVQPHVAYLNFYRAVEGLFRIILVDAFHARVAGRVAHDRRTLSNAIDAELMWRVKEDDSLKKLLARIPRVELDALVTRFAAKDVESLARFIYNTRNKIAHGSILEAPPQISPQVVGAAIALVESAYSAVAIDASWIA